MNPKICEILVGSLLLFLLFMSVVVTWEYSTPECGEFELPNIVTAECVER